MPPLVNLGVETSGLTKFRNAVKKADKPLAASLRAKLKTVGDVVAVKARSNASWSTKIPRSVKVGVTAKGVYVKAGGNAAPHAAGFESGGRHPVFGHRDRWVNMGTGLGGNTNKLRPFMLPALQASQQQIEDAAVAALDEWVKSLGFN